MRRGEAKSRSGSRAGAANGDPEAPGQAIRAFIACEISEEARSALAATQQSLAALNGPVHWAAPESMHITLKFLGNITEHRRRRIQDKLAPEVLEIQPFAFDLSRLGVFPNARRARVLWVGPVSGVAELVACQRRIDDVAASCGFAREERPFHPHVTIGRVRYPLDEQCLTAALNAGVIPPVAPIRVSGITLFRSHLSPAGSRYERLFVAPMATVAEVSPTEKGERQ
ncbi:MAG: RNA 2',3'-cyclic phosphodiesterase [Candidatus Schekmanbacteria bacterium]|nr:RNA 2',3'-cyclic phosphodiesterase [Candidatus Schekmanbacteria bacterium]